MRITLEATRHAPWARICFHAATHSSESAFGVVANTSGDSLRVLDTDSLFLIDMVGLGVWCIFAPPCQLSSGLLSRLPCAGSASSQVWLVQEEDEAGVGRVVVTCQEGQAANAAGITPSVADERRKRKGQL